MGAAATPARTFQGLEQGHPCHGLRSGPAELVMVPSLGGRIVSLRSRRTGREWCWRRPGEAWLWPSVPGAPFGDSCLAGLDECLPTVAACTVKGRELPDHGDLWARAWKLDPEALQAGVLQATLALDACPLVFSRTIQAEGAGRFRFSYALRNRGAEPEPWLWSLHPLTALAPGDRLVLPEEVRELRLDGGVGAPIRRGDRWAWPEPLPGLRLDEAMAPGMPGGCVKGFAGPLKEGFAAVVNETTGDRLAFRWNAAEVPFLGVWINRGFGGFHHVALEPTTGAPDSLAEALSDWGLAPTLPPGATARWSLTVEVA